jgi:AraC-like DNA-binding protein
MNHTLSLSAVLALLRVDAADSAIIELSAPGAVRWCGTRQVFLHLVLSGSVVIEIDETPQPVRIDKGGYAIVLAGRSHLLADEAGRTPIPSRYFQEEHQLDRPPTIRFGGAGGVARVLTSAFSIDPSARSVLRGLPDVVVGANGSSHAAGPILFDPGAITDSLHGAGATALVVALTELCLIQAVRTELMTIAVPDGAVPAILQHPQISAAVKMVKTRPGADWTVAKLATAVGMSRSSFATAFREHVGEPPAEYIAGRRMELAATMLTGRRRLVCDIARSVGYDSDSSFIRAFKKRFGSVPSEYRRLKQTPSRPQPAGYEPWETATTLSSADL